MKQNLKLDAACHSTAGIKAVNEDAVGLRIPEDDYLLNHKGVAMVVADGVSSAEAGQEASRTAVDRFLDEYYQTPDTWSVAKCGERILATINLRLFRKSHEFTTANKGYLSTFSALVIKGRTAHYFHVGDSRVYLLRDGQLTQLTQDHTAAIGDNKTTLARAVGMDNQINIDYGKVPLENNDIVLLTSDGIHDFLSAATIESYLAKSNSAEQDAKFLVRSAEEASSNDNISALVARVIALPEESIDDYNVKLTRLPFPPPLKAGMKLDGYRITREIFASSRSQLYLVEDIETAKCFVMKTPSSNYEDDIAYIDRFIQEEWVGLRINSPYVVKIIRQSRKRTFLYYLMEYIEGQGLDKWMEQNRPPSPKRAIALVKQIAEGLQSFHDNEAVHQDLKPGNILITRDERVKILDFGSVFVAGLAERANPIEHNSVLGTAGYSDPLYLAGQNPGIQGDVYSLATITYELFCGELPYGEAIEQCRTPYDYDQLRYRSASRYNPVIPMWFDCALRKATRFDLEARYQSIKDFMTDLLTPNAEFLRDAPEEQKNASTLVFWKLMSSFWFISFILLVYLFSLNKGA